MNKDTKTSIIKYKDLIFELHNEVYEPSDDSFLLADAIKVKKDDMVFEIGTGCGLIALYCAKKGANVVCSDVNPFAVETTKKNIEKNKHLITGNVDVRMGNLFNVLEIDEKFDVVVFNPPYLPTTKDDLVGGSGWFDIAVDGGLSGLDLIFSFIQGLDGCLKQGGCAFFVFSSLADRSKLEEMIKKFDYRFSIISSSVFDDEKLDVYSLKK